MVPWFLDSARGHLNPIPVPTRATDIRTQLVLVAQKPRAQPKGPEQCSTFRIFMLCCKFTEATLCYQYDK